MSYAVIWSNPAKADIRRLDRKTGNRLVERMVRYATTGYGDVRPIKSRPGQWRLSVGDWRVIYRPGKTPEGGDSITVLRVLPRSSAYRD